MNTYYTGWVLKSVASFFTRRDIPKGRDTRGGREATEAGVGALHLKSQGFSGIDVSLGYSVRSYIKTKQIREFIRKGI